MTVAIVFDADSMFEHAGCTRDGILCTEVTRNDDGFTAQVYCSDCGRIFREAFDRASLRRLLQQIGDPHATTH